MRAIFSLLLISFFSVSVLAGPNCTEKPKSTWLDQNSFQDKLKSDGYKIKIFKVTRGDCYEIYGWNKQGQKVEIYFDPVTGSKVKEEIED